MAGLKCGKCTVLQRWRREFTSVSQDKVMRQRIEPSRTDNGSCGYRGWYVLETNSPSKDIVADTRANIDYVKKTFRMPPVTDGRAGEF